MSSRIGKQHFRVDRSRPEDQCRRGSAVSHGDTQADDRDAAAVQLGGTLRMRDDVIDCFSA